MKWRLRLSDVVLAITAVVLFSLTSLQAATIQKEHAIKAVKNWVKVDKKPMSMEIGDRIKDVETFSGKNGQIYYHVVYMQPNGFVIVAGDDGVEPVICFCSGDNYDPDPSNPMGALVEGDIPQRVEAAVKIEKDFKEGKKLSSPKAGDEYNKAKGKWQKLLAVDSQQLYAGVPGVSDVRVGPLVTTKWSQDIACGQNCYNYYTPNNYYCGCVATAMAQLMRYHNYPTAGIGKKDFSVTVDGQSQTVTTKGGDENGGPYQWSSMTEIPEDHCPLSENNRKAIGALCFDAGAAVNMMYTKVSSGAYMNDASNAMNTTFLYSNSIFAANMVDFDYKDISALLPTMANPNLDAGYPVLLGIRGNGGHAIVADGYGYNSTTLYYHLNMGWAGQDDAWYNLPNIGTPYSFSSVETCGYNIFPSGTGEIVSGRVLCSNLGNSPVSGVTVTATPTQGGASFTVTTNDKGIYAIKGAASNKTYTITAVKAGYDFHEPGTATTGQSLNSIITTGNSTITTGNRWDVNIRGVKMGPPDVSDSDVLTVPGLQTKINLNVTDEGLPTLPGKCYCTIRSLPKYGSLIDYNDNNIINTVPYVLRGYENNVYYQSLNCYDGLDDFTFDANDGGTPPNAGQSSRTAKVTVNMKAQTGTIFDEDFSSGLPGDWQIIDGPNGVNDEKTWTINNPKHRFNVYWDDHFMLVDSDYYKNAELDEQLITPVFSCTRMKNVTVEFSHCFKCYPYGNNEKCDVDVRSNNGPWQNVARWQGASTSGDVVVPISQFADGKNNVQIRWHYYDAKYEWYWGIDDVEIRGAPVTRMSPDFDYDCNVDWIDFGKLATGWMMQIGEPNYPALCDISKTCDGIIDHCDVSVFSQYWLQGMD